MNEKEINKIEDFGEKIGGARKDLYKTGLKIDDFEDLNDLEKAKYVVKKYIWKKPEYKELREEKGYSPEKIIYVRNLYNALPAKPRYSDFEDYFNYVSIAKNMCEKLLDIPEEDFNKAIVSPLTLKEFTGCDTEKLKSNVFYASRKVTKCLWNYPDDLSREVLKEKFLLDEDEYLNRRYCAKEVNFYKESTPWNDNYYRYKVDGINIKYDAAYLHNDLVNNFNQSMHKLYCVFDNLNNTIVRIGTDEDKNSLLYETMQEAEFSLADVKKAYKLANILIQAGTEIAQEQAKPESNRKKKFVYSELKSIERKGDLIIPDDIEVEGDDYLKLGFKGGEFGNWQNQKERQSCLNAGYEAFIDLAEALGVSAESITLNNSLNIAFGSRGVAHAVAHYEPARNVINLTKMRGAGALAHEWGHALETNYESSFKEEFRAIENAMKYKKVTKEWDAMFSKDSIEASWRTSNNFMNDLKTYGYQLYYHPEDGKQPPHMPTFYNNQKARNNVAKINETLKDYFKEDRPFTDEEWSFVKDFCKKNSTTLKDSDRDEIEKLGKKEQEFFKSQTNPVYETREVETDYYKESKEFDTLYSKSGQGYWQSDEELWARAFELYVHDKLQEKGLKSDYLCGLANCSGPIPKDEEKDAVFEKIDNLIDSMKKYNFLTPEEPSKNKIVERAINDYLTENNIEDKYDVSELVEEFRNENLSSIEELTSSLKGDKNKD